MPRGARAREEGGLRRQAACPGRRLGSRGSAGRPPTASPSRGRAGRPRALRRRSSAYAMSSAPPGSGAERSQPAARDAPLRSRRPRRPSRSRRPRGRHGVAAHATVTKSPLTRPSRSRRSRGRHGVAAHAAVTESPAKAPVTESPATATGRESPADAQVVPSSYGRLWQGRCRTRADPLPGFGVARPWLPCGGCGAEEDTFPVSPGAFRAPEARQRGAGPGLIFQGVLVCPSPESP
jgi:hypothetical protein